MPLGLRVLRGVLMGLLVRKDPYIGYVSGVGSFSFVTGSLGCYRVFVSWYWIWGPGLSGGAIFWLIGLSDVAIHAIYCDGCLLGFFLLGCWTRPGCGCLRSCPLWFFGLHGGIAVEMWVAERSGCGILDAWTIFRCSPFVMIYLYFIDWVIWHVILMNFLNV